MAAAVEAARVQIADGSLRGFSDKEELLEYLQGPAAARGRVVGGVELFEDRLPSGVSVTSFVDDQARYSPL